MITIRYAQFEDYKDGGDKMHRTQAESICAVTAADLSLCSTARCLAHLVAVPKELLQSFTAFKFQERNGSMRGFLYFVLMLSRPFDKRADAKAGTIFEYMIHDLGFLEVSVVFDLHLL